MFCLHKADMLSIVPAPYLRILVRIIITDATQNLINLIKVPISEVIFFPKIENNWLFTFFSFSWKGSTGKMSKRTSHRLTALSRFIFKPESATVSMSTPCFCDM